MRISTSRSPLSLYHHGKARPVCIFNSFSCNQTNASRNQLPIGLINAAKGHPIMVELKTGESYNGLLDNIDNFMNVFLKEAVHTSPDGKQFKKVKEVYIRGNNVSDNMGEQAIEMLWRERKR